jgi:acyl-CoA synthetase (AMP-forming)/AMP-acid ligase II/acyl carrier protein
MHQAVLELARSQPALVEKIHLRFIRSSSSSLPPAVAEGLEKALRAPVLEAYGMTEATHQMASNPLPPRARKFGSVGLPTGTTRISILDDQGNLMPTNSLGEIGIRGENVISGYENNPAANTSSFTAGWLRTGDRGYLDEDGYLFIQGRLKEIFNRGGEKLSPREIDDVLLQHPAVSQAVAFAVPHPTLGEDVAAAVVLRPGSSLTATQLRQFAGQKLSEFKIPRQVVFLSEIPKGPTGKIQRIGLAEKLSGQLAAARTAAGSAVESDAVLNPVELIVIDIWRQVLGLEVISVDDDFVALGGDSLRIMQVLSRINQQFGTSLSLTDLFDAMTVRDVAALIKEA